MCDWSSDVCSSDLALNEHPAWIEAMSNIVLENLQGWVSKKWNKKDALAAAKLTQSRAQAMLDSAPK